MDRVQHIAVNTARGIAGVAENADNLPEAVGIGMKIEVVHAIVVETLVVEMRVVASAAVAKEATAISVVVVAVADTVAVGIGMTSASSQ
jgi:hypothetical protein